MLLENKTAVISGAASPRGIGLATARLFAQHGAHVVIIDLDIDASTQAARELGDGHIGLACDVADPDACERAASRTIQAFGGVDILINNAGITQSVKTMDIDQDSWNLILDVNLRGVLNLSQAFIPHMRSRQSGSIACM